MGDLFWNKVFGAILAVVLVVMGLQTLSGMVFSSGEGGHHGEEAHSLNEWAQSRFSYYTEIAETGGAGAAVLRPEHASRFCASTSRRA